MKRDLRIATYAIIIAYIQYTYIKPSVIANTNDIGICVNIEIPVHIV